MFYLYKDRENETGTDWVFPSLGTWEQSRQSSRPRYSHSHLQEDVSSICWGAQFLRGFICCYINSSIVVIPSIMVSLDMNSLFSLLWVCSPQGLAPRAVSYLWDWWFASGASYERESKGWLFDEATHRARVWSPVIKLFLCSGHFCSFYRLQHRQLKWSMNMYSLVSPKHGNMSEKWLGASRRDTICKEETIHGGWRMGEFSCSEDYPKAKCCHAFSAMCLKEFPRCCFISLNPPGNPERHRLFSFLPIGSSCRWGGWASARPGPVAPQ